MWMICTSVVQVFDFVNNPLVLVFWNFKVNEPPSGSNSKVVKNPCKRKRGGKKKKLQES
jgi:hypothetical protein